MIAIMRISTAFLLLLMTAACDHSASFSVPSAKYEISDVSPKGDASKEKEAPSPPAYTNAWVFDRANILSDDTEQAITHRLDAVQNNTGHQFVVMTTPSLDGKTVEDYAHNLANEWGIGRKEYGDGILLLVAPTERKVRIALGHGLECDISDGLAKQIIDTKMIPLFKQGDYDAATRAGAMALASLLDNIPNDTRAKAQAVKTRATDNPNPCVSFNMDA